MDSVHALRRRERTQAELTRKFLPVVKSTTDQVGLAEKYTPSQPRAARWD